MVDHLKEISSKDLTDFRENLFTRFYYCKGIELGINGFGKYVVRGIDKNLDYFNRDYFDVDEAIYKYKELVKSKL